MSPCTKTKTNKTNKTKTKQTKKKKKTEQNKNKTKQNDKIKYSKNYLILISAFIFGSVHSVAPKHSFGILNAQFAHRITTINTRRIRLQPEYLQPFKNNKTWIFLENLKFFRGNFHFNFLIKLYFPISSIPFGFLYFHLDLFRSSPKQWIFHQPYSKTQQKHKANTQRKHKENTKKYPK